MALIKHIKFDGTDTGLTLIGPSSGSPGPQVNEPIGDRTAVLFDGALADSYEAANGTHIAAHPNLLDIASNTQSFTLEAWINPTSIAASGPPGYRFTSIFSKGMVYVSFGYEGNGKLKLYTYNGGAHYITSNNSVVQANEWQHVALVSDAGIISMYHNGVSVPLSSTALIAPEAGGRNVAPKIGHADTTQAADGFVGYMDELKVYDHALSSSEVMELYTGPFYQHPEDDTSLDPTSESSGWTSVGQNNLGGGSFSWHTITPGDDKYLIIAPHTPYSSVFIEQEKTYNFPFAHNYVRIKFDYYHVHVIPNVMLYADGQLIHTFTSTDSQGVSISPHPYLTWGQGVVGVDVIIPHTANTLSLKIAGGYAPSQRRAAFSPVEIYVDNPDYATGFVERTYAASILAADSIMCFRNGAVLSPGQFSHTDGSLTLDNNLDISIDDKLIIVKVK